MLSIDFRTRGCTIEIPLCLGPVKHYPLKYQSRSLSVPSVASRVSTAS